MTTAAQELDWPAKWSRLLETPQSTAQYRQQPEDFIVEEGLDFSPEGEGEHEWLWVEKRGITTPDMLRAVSKLSGVAQRDIGFSGLKDREAITRQWISLQLPGKALDESVSAELQTRGIHILQSARHPRKLKRGVHQSNRFTLRLQGDAIVDGSVQSRWQQLLNSGVPNYFGPQRFGDGGRNLQRAFVMLQKGWRKRDDTQGLMLSTARSYLFNQVLSKRLSQGSWDQPQAGDVLNLEGSQSRFVAEQIDETLIIRAKEGDLHPTGPLWGVGRLDSQAEIAQLETQVVANYPTLSEGLVKAGVRQERRALRLLLKSASFSQESDDCAVISFELATGAFATAVLRELFLHPTLV